MFKGHKFVKLINSNWVFDINEFKAYKVETDSGGIVLNYTPAFKVIITKDGDVNFDRYITVPVKILKEASTVVKDMLNEVEV